MPTMQIKNNYDLLLTILIDGLGIGYFHSEFAPDGYYVLYSLREFERIDQRNPCAEIGFYNNLHIVVVICDTFVMINANLKSSHFDLADPSSIEQIRSRLTQLFQ